jgi:hypothetical protein
MRRLGVAPTVEDVERQSPSVTAWLQTLAERMNVYSGAADPIIAEVPENQWIVYNNTTVPEVRIWTNIAGVLKKSAAFV